MTPSVGLFEEDGASSAGQSENGKAGWVGLNLKAFEEAGLAEEIFGKRLERQTDAVIWEFGFQGAPGADEIVGFDRESELRRKKGGGPTGSVFIPTAGFDLVSGKPDESVSLADMTGNLLNLGRGGFRDISQHEDINFCEIFGGKREPWDRPNDKILISTCFATGQECRHDQSTGIAIRTVNTEDGDFVANDGDRAAHIINCKRVSGDFSGDSGGPRVEERNEQRNSLR